MTDNYLECTHCGEIFYYELTSCPNCGISVYPDESEQEPEIHEETIYGEVVGDILAVAVGWFVTGVLGVLIYMVTIWIFGERAYMMPFQILRYASLPASAFLGGYITVAITSRSPLIFGALVGVLSISFTILIASYERNLVFEPLFTPGMILWWGIILLAGVGGALANARLSERAAIDQLFSLPESEDELYQDLYIKVGYDHARVERLLELERDRFPDASRYYLLKSAIRHWERDNR